MLHLGFPVQNVYETLHLEEIKMSHAQAVASKEAERVASSIRANGQRPSENGTTTHQPQQVSKNISSLSRKELDSIIEEAALGKRITF
jgi:hypothetical protein